MITGCGSSMPPRSILKRPLSQGPRRRARKPVTPSPSLGGRVRKYFDYRGHLQRGDSLAISSVPDSIWDFGSKYVFEGDYWGSPCQVAGRLECIVMGKGGKHAQVLLRGTDHPELKAWAESTITSGNPAEVSIHLCPANCTKTALARGSPHGTTVRLEAPGDLWAGNLEGLQLPVPGGIGDLEADLKKIAERGAPDAKPEDPIPPEKGPEDQKNMKTGCLSFVGTPLDSKLSVRRILKARKTKKRGKKKKKKSRGRRRRRSTSSSNSNGDSACSSGSSGGSIDSADSGHPFREGHRVKQLAKRVPGILTRHAIDEMNRLLVQHLGEEGSSIIKPVLLRYIRLHVTVKNVPPAQKRELLTLGYTMDRLLQRDFLGAMDLITQRVKAIEMVLGGASWAVAQNLELVPLEQEMITSVAEAQGAAREFRREAKVQRDTGKGKGRWQEDWKTKKGDGKKGDGKSPKGGGKASQATRADPTKPN